MEAKDRLVSEVMQTEVVTLLESDRLDLAEDIMSLGNIRHMPVLDAEGKVVGMVSNRDLLAASLSKTLDFDPQQRRAFIRSVGVDEVMTRKIVSVAPDARLREVAALMLRRKVGSVAVTKPDGSLAGLVTETDLIRAALLGGDLSAHADEEPEEGERAGWAQRELDTLRQTRDELRVRIHLGQADAKDRWDELEHKFRELEGKARQIARATEEPLQDVREAAKLLLQEIREGYRRIRAAL